MFYGNWCGPYWTAGQIKSTSQITEQDFDVPALNELDQVCKQHDVDLFQATDEQDVRRANKRFQRAARSLGITGRLFAWLVGKFGPNAPEFTERELLMLPPVTNLRPTTHMPTKRQIDFDLDPRGHSIESASKKMKEGTPDTIPRMVPVQRFDRPIIDRSDSIDMEFGQIFSEAVRNPNPTSSTMTTTVNATSERLSTSTTAGRGHHGETDVDFKVTRYNPVDKTQQVIMPFVKKGVFGYATDGTIAQKLCFRLNSVFDIFSTTDQGTVIDKGENPAIDPSDGQNNREVPAFREFWKKLYHYWHVVECKWKFHYRYQNPREHFAPGNATLYFYEHGMQNPPDHALVNNVAQLIPGYIRKYHPHCRVARVKPWNSTRYEGTLLTADKHCDELWDVTEGTFRPGMIAHEVVEDEFNQVWHKWGEVPPTAEKLTIMLQPGDRDLDPATLKLNQSFNVMYYMEMEFVVQMKDRIFAFEFINQGSDFPGTLDIINIPPPA